MQTELHILKNFGFRKKAQSTALKVSLDSTSYKKFLEIPPSWVEAQDIAGTPLPLPLSQPLKWHLDILVWPWSALVSPQAETTVFVLERFVPDTVLGMEWGFSKYLLNLMEPFLKVLKFIMASVHFVQLPPLNFKRAIWNLIHYFRFMNTLFIILVLLEGSIITDPVRRYYPVVRFPMRLQKHQKVVDTIILDSQPYVGRQALDIVSSNSSLITWSSSSGIFPKTFLKQQNQDQNPVTWASCWSTNPLPIHETCPPDLQPFCPLKAVGCAPCLNQCPGAAGWASLPVRSNCYSSCKDIRPKGQRETLCLASATLEATHAASVAPVASRVSCEKCCYSYNTEEEWAPLWLWRQSFLKSCKGPDCCGNNGGHWWENR